MRAPGRSTDDLLTVVAFLAALWVPLVTTCLGPHSELSRGEQRRLAALPRLAWSASEIGSLPRELEAWWNDHLGFRDDLIRIHAWLEIRALGVSPTPTLVVGREGWLFLGDAEAVEQYRGLAHLEPDELRRWQEVLEERRDWLARRGIAYVVAIAPNKHTIYGEFMPESLTRVRDESPLDQLVRYLGSHSDVRVLDLREPLRRAKQDARVYHRTDTHWNDRGAYVAYHEILTVLAREVPALADARPVPIRARRRIIPGRGLAHLVGLENVFREEVVEIAPRFPRARLARGYRRSYSERLEGQQPVAFEVQDQGLPRAVVFRDSFGNALIPFLSEHFRRVLYVWRPNLEPAFVEEEQPDVVIHEIAERFLGRPPRGIREIVAGSDAPVEDVPSPP